MTRKQLFERVLSMMNHISELQEKHGWTDEDTRHAIGLLDDGAPIDLHLAGSSVKSSFVPECILMLPYK